MILISGLIIVIPVHCEAGFAVFKDTIRDHSAEQYQEYALQAAISGNDIGDGGVRLRSAPLFPQIQARSI